MTPELWNKIINFIKRTGQTALITDANKKDVYVVSSLESFEERFVNNRELQELTENELLDRINQDIADWQANQSALSVVESSKKVDDETDDEQYYVEPTEEAL